LGPPSQTEYIERDPEGYRYSRFCELYRPENTDVSKRKKNAWKDARANPHLVRSVWRNNTMQPAKSYTPLQARDLFESTRVVMIALAAL
jgi:hypothetical protein